MITADVIHIFPAHPPQNAGATTKCRGSDSPNSSVANTGSPVCKKLPPLSFRRNGSGGSFLFCAPFLLSFLCSCVPEAARPSPMASSRYIILPDRMNRDVGNINFFARYEFQMTGYEISPGKACTNCNFINDSPATANDELNTAEQALNE